MPDDDGAEDAAVSRRALNPLFHEPARLALLSALAPAEYTDFASLLRITGVSKSALSKHLSALADAGVIEVGKSDTDRRGRRIALTMEGRVAFESYLDALDAIVQRARR
ncbi:MULTISPECIES: transcriptional regulator [unclassified Plantibacter]|uniref:transcriptional regulator n=1 Tax=unclassified Plantibacter TaxID=2624265 RepID=UPI00177E4443|nr:MULTISPECIES: transcriptional regulator [unclassified Plantibacter]MBD8100805.1 transcriptional regulator [Plantibacter sp. CFBP 8775]MBD8518400.1 transcriptional regulator [Plantibacter sp. CFBP 8804]MBD8533658.1 transcriptional regulator [Plantibacter sp. CFBP 13570]